MNGDTPREHNDLLQTYADDHAKDAATAQRAAEGQQTTLLTLSVRDLLSVLATRVTDPGAMFATPEDRYGLTDVSGQTQLGGPMTEFGKKVALRCGRALHDFLCEKSGENPQLREKLTKIVFDRDISGVGIVAGALVTLVGMAPAVSIVVATVIIKVLVVPTIDVLCDQWDAALAEGLDKATASTQASAP